MQFQVPQFIETEDKIVGPLTLRQFIYVAVAGVFSAMLYFSIGGFVWVLLSLILFGIALGLAFVKVEGRPLFNVVVAAGHFYWRPQTYIWQPNHPMLGSIAQKSAKRSIVTDSVEKMAARRVSYEPSVAHTTVRVEQPILMESREQIAIGASLHRSWSDLQTGIKASEAKVVEKKMETRYQIFQRPTGDKRAAKRIDYR